MAQAGDTAVGERAPGLTLPTADGGEFDLSGVGGRAALITFLSHAA